MAEEEPEVEPHGSPIAVLIAPATFTLAFAKTMAHSGTGAPVTRPQVHL